jgi:hypothetical protein
VAIGGFCQNRRSVLAYQAEHGRMRKGQVRRHIPAEPLSVDGGGFSEVAMNMFQRVEVASEELADGAAAMLRHDENVVAGPV